MLVGLWNKHLVNLQRIYGDSAVFFHDCCGGTAIGGVWNPVLSTERPFRVLLGFSSQPTDVSNPKVRPSCFCFVYRIFETNHML